MVAKKKSLRTKAARSSNKEETVTQQFDFGEDPKAFLHVARETKKEKLANKHNEFKKQIITSATGGISKSALRRRKRKARDDLKPKMEDLLTTLENAPETEVVTTTFTNHEHKYVPEKAVDANLPNIRNKKGSKKIHDQEVARFNAVLGDTSFKQSPFAALREAIKNRK